MNKRFEIWREKAYASILQLCPFGSYVGDHFFVVKKWAEQYPALDLNSRKYKFDFVVIFLKLW